MIVLLILFLSVLLGPTALALDQEELLDRQAASMDLDTLGRAGERYTGTSDIAGGLDVAGILQHVVDRGREAFDGAVRTSVRSCVLLLVIALLCGLAEGLKVGPGGDVLRVTTLAASLAIATVAAGDVHSLLGMGERAMADMQGLGDVLLPAVSIASAASGAPAAAAVKHGITIMFSDLLLRLIGHLLIPLCYAFVAVHVAWAALGNDGLKRIGGMLKWIVSTVLTVFLLAFIAYLDLSGVISGSADAATIKAAKFTISNLVPVVGGIVSDTAETLLAGASVLRNGAGVFGMLAVLGICVVPFLYLGAHYLMYRLAAALAATVSGDGRVTGLIEAIGTAFGLILAMTGSCAVLLIVAMISAVSATVL